VLRLLKQLSEVYSSMHISEVGKLVPFMSFSDVEAVVVDAVKYDYLQVRMFVLPIHCRACSRTTTFIGWR
jgi:translation initiation factor 3 subunit A